MMQARHMATFVWACAITACALTQVTSAQGAGPYAVVNTFKVGGEGGWDYATVDDKGEFLYLPRGTHTLVVDARTGATTADIKAGKGLHGVALAPQAGRGFITDGKAGEVIVFDLKSHEVLGAVPVAEDADDVRFDPATNRVLAVCGDAALMGAFAPDADPKGAKVEKLDLGGKPESFAVDGQGKAYVALVDKDAVAVVDLKAMKVESRFPTGAGQKPTGLGLDAAKGRLFVGCRNGKCIVMDAKDGKVLADLPIGKGVDATAMDGDTALSSCSDGTLTAVRETSPGKFEVVQTLKTAPGARTMAVDAKAGRAYLPAADMQPAQGGGRPRPIPGTFKVIVVERKPA